MKIIPQNGYILVKELKRKEDEKATDTGIILPEESLEDDEVAQGTVVVSGDDKFTEGQILLFHKTLPVDALLKMDGDEKPTEYFFVKGDVVVCVVQP